MLRDISCNQLTIGISWCYKIGKIICKIVKVDITKELNYGVYTKFVIRDLTDKATLNVWLEDAREKL